MTESPNRSQLLEVARKHILERDSRFSLKTLCEELRCNRSDIRRHFSTKAELVSAVFGAEPVDQPVAVPQPMRLGGKLPSDKALSDDDWIARRFRVFERAIATLESNIEDVRSECAQSITELKEMGGVTTPRTTVTADLTRRIPEGLDSSTLGGDRSEPLHRTGRPPEGNFPAAASDSNHSVQASSDELPPIVTRVHSPEQENPSCSSPGDDELLFITAPEDFRGSDNWKDLVFFGVTAFVAALAVAALVLTLTSRAGATDSFRSEKRTREATLPAATGPAKTTSDSGAARPPIVIDASEIAMHETLAASGGVQPAKAEDMLSNMVSLNDAGTVEPRAKVRLALTYLKGDGVRSDMLMGAFWSAAAAQQGDAEAQFVLGSLYAEGIKPDPKEAYRWLLRAASLNNPKAMHNVAIALLSGVGVATDKLSAVDWFRRAADLGYRDSAFDLGVLYERGEGVKQNSRTALSWYDKAARMGDQQAAQRATLLRSDGLEVESSN